MNKYSFPTEKEIVNIKKFVSRKRNKDIKELKKVALQWTRTAWDNKMDYEISWFGIPIIQNPYDMVVMQELIFNIKPNVIIETGIAHGGSLIYYASLLEILGNKGKVIGVDIDIRKHNRKLLDKHPLIKGVTMIEGSSIDEKIISQINKLIKRGDKVLVILDSDHRKPHVYAELNAYKNIVSKNSYIVVFDTFMPYLVGLEHALKDFKKNSAMDAVKQFISKNKNFKIDKSYNKFFVTSCPNGFLKKVK